MIIDAKNIDFGSYLEAHSFLEAGSIKNLSEFRDDVAEYSDTGDTINGAKMPWGKTEQFTRVCDGKLSIWAGVNGSGKSLMLGQVITGLMKQGRRAVIASLEMQPKQTIYRMICQSSTTRASREYSLGWMDHFQNSLWIYDQLDRIAVNRVLGMACYAANELGANDIVIDSLTKCGVGRDDYAAQATFVDRLQWCAKTWNVHIHLVCHMRKSNAPGHREGKNDIRGAAEITDLADNVYIIRRNKAKEKQVELMNADFGYDEEIVMQPCAYFGIEKNRDFGHETEFGLWFDRLSGQYTDETNKKYPPLDVPYGC